MSFVFDSVPDLFMTQKLCDKLIFNKPFLLKNCFESYKTQEMCDEAGDACMLALKFVPDWSVTSEIIKKIDNAVFSNHYIIFGDIDSETVSFFSSDVRLNSVNLIDINFNNANFGDYDPRTINRVKIMTWYNRYK